MFCHGLQLAHWVECSRSVKLKALISNRAVSLIGVHTPSTGTSDYNTSYITAIYKCFMTSANRENPHSHTRTAVTCPYTVMSIDR